MLTLPPPLLKVPFLISAGIAASRAFTSPTPPPPRDDMERFRSKVQDKSSTLAYWMPPTFKYTTWLLVLAEVAVILAARKQTAPISQSVLSALTFKHPSSASGIAISYPFMAGWVLVILGALIRDACYRYLGRQFTFQLALLKGHKLVTDGPYAVVRHPSYTGWIIHTTGLLVMQTCGGSWIAECGMLDTLVGRLVVMGYILFHLYIDAAVVDRTWREDEALREEFGEQWEQWSKRTPYRLLPGVF